MLLFALVACVGMGTFQTADGPEPVRGALFFQPDPTLSLAVADARQTFVLLTNSTVACHPDDVENDPRTQTDEVAQAETYWEWQITAAFSREGALAMAVVLAVDPVSDWIGHYDLHADAWDNDALADYVHTDGRVAAGAWYEVQEATSDTKDGVNPENVVVESDYEQEVGAPASVDVSRADELLEGEFTFTPADLSGTFKADRCDNMDLLATLYIQLEGLSAVVDTDTLATF